MSQAKGPYHHAIGHAYTKMYLLFIWNSHFTRHPVFHLAPWFFGCTMYIPISVRAHSSRPILDALTSFCTPQISCSLQPSSAPNLHNAYLDHLFLIWLIAMIYVINLVPYIGCFVSYIISFLQPNVEFIKSRGCIVSRECSQYTLVVRHCLQTCNTGDEGPLMKFLLISLCRSNKGLRSDFAALVS